MLQDEYLIAEIGFETAEKEPPTVSMKWGIDPAPYPPTPLGMSHRTREYTSRACKMMSAFGDENGY